MVTVCPFRSWLQTKLGFNKELRLNGGVVEGAEVVVTVVVTTEVVVAVVTEVVVVVATEVVVTVVVVAEVVVVGAEGLVA
jgi:hypothetical protein